MSERQTGPYDAIARRWLALVERRQEHFLELCDTGRWRHYYTQSEFLIEMKKVLWVRDRWAAIAGVPVSEEELDEETFFSDRDMRPPAPAVVGMPVSPWPE